MYVCIYIYVCLERARSRQLFASGKVFLKVFFGFWGG